MVILAVDIVGDRASDSHHGSARSHRKHQSERHQPIFQRIHQHPALDRHVWGCLVQLQNTIAARGLEVASRRAERFIAVAAQVSNDEGVAWRRERLQLCCYVSRIFRPRQARDTTAYTAPGAYLHPTQIHRAEGAGQSLVGTITVRIEFGVL